MAALSRPNRETTQPIIFATSPTRQPAGHLYCAHGSDCTTPPRYRASPRVSTHGSKSRWAQVRWLALSWSYTPKGIGFESLKYPKYFDGRGNNLTLKASEFSVLTWRPPYNAPPTSQGPALGKGEGRDRGQGRPSDPLQSCHMATPPRQHGRLPPGSDTRVRKLSGKLKVCVGLEGWIICCSSSIRSPDAGSRDDPRVEHHAHTSTNIYGLVAGATLRASVTTKASTS